MKFSQPKMNGGERKVRHLRMLQKLMNRVAQKMLLKVNLVPRRRRKVDWPAEDTWGNETELERAVFRCSNSHH